MLDTICRVFIISIFISYSLLSVALAVWPARRPSRASIMNLLPLQAVRILKGVRLAVRRLEKRAVKPRAAPASESSLRLVPPARRP
jgi:hypothetical protein